MRDLIFFVAEYFVAPNEIEGEIFCHLGHPGRRVFWNAVIGPRLQGSDQSLLHHVFGAVEMLQAEDSRQGRGHFRRLVPEKMFHYLGDFVGG